MCSVPSNPKPEKIGREIQLFILSDVEKIAEFDPKWGSRWQIHKCVGSGVCCSEKFRDAGRATAKKQNFRYAAHNTHKKVLIMQTSYQGKVYTPKVCLLADSAHQTGNPKPDKIVVFWKMFSSIAEFIGEITYVELEWRSYHQTTPCVGGSPTNENDYRQKTAFAAWRSRIDASRQYCLL